MSVYSDHEYRKRTAALKRRAKRDNLPCWICGRKFDWSITDHRKPQYFTADHVEPLASGGALLGELRPAHRSCNSRRGDGRQRKNELKPFETLVKW
ncbi:HNH endonuclease [Arthrobacter phage CallinAllBarbz]|uniref:HNH endonuclease n=1 Tax=Arthrobacter phage CallinAllBarbz TaxID=3077790 RepID=A0AA96HDA0_9CAUD|nr:HNH endonuclease [Arthrobacter phage CallinAllBarbz]